MNAIAQIAATPRSRRRPKSRRLVGVGGPPHIRRQIQVASRLAPAEAFRSHTALLLSCGEATDCADAEEAVRERWPTIAVQALACPVGSWTELLDETAGSDSWLRHLIRRKVQREMRRHAPNLVVILDRGESAGRVEARTLAATFRSWDLPCPIAVLRADESGAFEWLVAPGAILEQSA